MPQERKTRVPIYVTQDELERIRRAAARAGESMSEWGRRKLLGERMNQEQSEQPTAPREESRQLAEARHAVIALVECLTWQFNDVPPWDWALEAVEAALGPDHSYTEDLREWFNEREPGGEA